MLLKTLISLNRIRCFSRHGCLDEESMIGGEFEVDLSVNGNFSKAMQSDVLADTVDYVAINALVEREMSVSAKLIEHVAWRIASTLFKEFKEIEDIKLIITKINPPLSGDVASVGFSLETSRDIFQKLIP